MSDNNIGIIPPEIGQLVNLRELCVSCTLSPEAEELLGALVLMQASGTLLPAVWADG
eukprot:COSAG02_NODE_35852_length_462_cov_1.055096_1_plen_56_part_01